MKSLKKWLKETFKPDYIEEYTSKVPKELKGVKFETIIEAVEEAAKIESEFQSFWVKNLDNFKAKAVLDETFKEIKRALIGENSIMKINLGPIPIENRELLNELVFEDGKKVRLIYGDKTDPYRINVAFGTRADEEGEASIDEQIKQAIKDENYELAAKLRNSQLEKLTGDRKSDYGFTE